MSSFFAAFRWTLHFVLPVLGAALATGCGAGVLHLAGVQGASTAWLMAVPGLGVGLTLALKSARRVQQQWRRDTDELARQLRRAILNERFEQPIPATTADASELVRELNHVLRQWGERQQQWQTERAGLAQLAHQQEDALQQAVNARKSAQEKLQKLARELDNRNRELKAALELSEAADRTKAEFLANMSHELRTPLNAVMGVASLLDRSSLSDRQRQQVGMISESGKSLLSTLNDVMDYVRMEAGEITLDHFLFNLNDTLLSVFMRHRELAVARGLEYRFDYAEAAPRLFEGDGARIQQLVHSLLDNAIKFTQEGHVNLHVSGYALQSIRYLVRIEVRDTGIGIPAEQRQRLFQAFTQGDASFSRAYGGSGIGLAICARLVKLMNGMLGMDSEPGKGSLFWVELPLQLYRDR